VLVESILEKGLDNKNLGVDGNGIGPSQFGMLTKRLPKAKLNDAVQDLSWIRAVKTPEEVARIETITKITEKGFDAVEEAAIEGISERELAVAFRKFLAAEEEVAIGMCKFLCGSRGAAPLTPISDYRLKKGELIQLHASLNRKYYHSDIARGAVAGQPSEKQRAVWKAIVKGEEEIIKHVRPGVKASELFRIGVQAVSAFLPRYERWHTGHGLGLTGVKEYDPPTLSPHDERELEENMVLSIETPYYEIGFGGMNLEDTGVVTKSGFRIFSSHRADLKSV
jgi:Xaa-Pro aminopeptidase